MPELMHWSKQNLEDECLVVFSGLTGKEKRHWNDLMVGSGYILRWTLEIPVVPILFPVNRVFTLAKSLFSQGATLRGGFLRP